MSIMATRQWRTLRALTGVLAIAGLLTMSAPVRAQHLGAPTNAAPDGPGALSHFDLARKDCVGTARNQTSKVWFTVANGVLSDVYYPTIDNTNVETLQYVVTDGATFTDLQTRNMTYAVQRLDPQNRALDCRVTSSAKSGKYRIITDYLTDPAHNTVVMQTRFEPIRGKLSDYRLYVRFDPTLNGNGGGGSANAGADSGSVDTSTGHAIPVGWDTNTKTNAANRDYAQPVYSALDASRPFLQVSNGFAGGSSDGLTQLDAGQALTTTYTEADNGNLVQTARVDLSKGGSFSLALGFGKTQSEAVSQVRGTLSRESNDLRQSYEKLWQQYDHTLIAPSQEENVPPKPMSGPNGLTGDAWRALVDQYYLSANVIKASIDKTFPGAIAASLTSPWGQAISAGDPNNTYFGSYREVFARDLYEAWTALMADGDLQAARDAVNFLFYRQQRPDGSMPRNSLVNGKLAPDSFNTQLDECSYPILMADQLGMTNRDLYENHIKRAANFVISHGPSFGPERWEEQSGYSPSTIAAEVAGLIAAAHIGDVNHDAKSAAMWRGVADDYQRSIQGWAVTTNGPLSKKPYYIRLSRTGDPNAAISYNVGNGGPTLDQREVIDAGFLELVRLGLKPANDPDIVNSLPVVDKTIETNTSTGPGWHRYNGDGYGDGATDGHPWAPSNKGTGHLWPALAGERGEYDLVHGDSFNPLALLQTMQRMASGVGLIPEQDWELHDLAASPYGTDPTVASIGFRNGHPAGSAAPLTWSMGQFVRLFRDISANRLLDRPAETYNRYVLHHQGQTSLTVTAPQDQSVIDQSPVAVAGTTAKGNTVYISATNTDNTFVTTTYSLSAPNGTFSISIPVTGGNTVINVVAVSPNGATAHVERTVYFDFTPGTKILDLTDPTGDDNGPGNYAYPTASDFHAGAFDIQRFRIFDDGTNTYFKLQTRDLSPTFGSPLGAQLIDVYVHDPNAAAADTSTAASFPQRNYAIASGSAWSRLIEVQGFGQRYIDAHGATLGSVNISANQISRNITFSVSDASLGHIGKGWGFTVVLTGQDGFSSDQARGFAPTPQPYQFGVCAAASNDPHCTFDPTKVPKAMDVLTPPGVSQSDELDYTKHSPVTLQDVTIQ